MQDRSYKPREGGLSEVGFPFTAKDVARALGGDVIGHNRALVPGPGHSRRDRSLAVLVDDGAPDGFLCNSKAGDDRLTCRTMSARY